MPQIAPWDRRSDDTRQEDTLKTFIIFCEDNNSEPFYFRSFNSDKIKINAIENQKQGRLNLLNAIQKCKDDGLIVFDQNCYRVIEGITERIWCVYDRDLEHMQWDQIRPQNHIDFDMAIQTASQAGLKIAWSNDVFELWVLLHFEDVPHKRILHRDYIYGRLSEIFRRIMPRTVELDRITSNPHFNYKSSFKRREYFVSHVLPLLRSNVQAAIERAQHLERNFDAGVAFHLRNPCTLVHHLVSDLLKP